ncbi:MAG: phosphoribosylanthranilate isomerase [Candidatus Dormibacteria bacterium]
MIVKVCGISTAGIADVAVDAGADWLGLVFERRSPRYVDDRAAAEVRAAAGSAADCVGVLVEPTPAAASALIDRHRLAAVQLHGRVEPDIVTEIDAPVIRGLNVIRPGEALTAQWWPDGLVLLDSIGGGRDGLPGGTGIRLDWAAARHVAAHRRIVLAGGLTAENVAEAIATVRPWGVDASSALESSPGVKDAGRVRAFVAAARGALDRLAAPATQAAL